MDVNKVIKLFKAFRKAVNQPVKEMSYSGKAGWFSLDGVKTRLPGLVAEAQAAKGPGVSEPAQAFLAELGEKHNPPAKSGSIGKPAPAKSGQAPAAKRGPGRPRKEGASPAPAPAAKATSKAATKPSGGSSRHVSGGVYANGGGMPKARKNTGGRPKLNGTDSQPMEKVTVTVSQDHKTILAQMGGGSVSAGLRVLVGHFQTVQNEIAAKAMKELAHQQG